MYGDYMIQNHLLNMVESLELYQEFEDIIKIKECYTNIFYIFSRKRNSFRYDGWKVAYGYVSILPGLPIMARHCFIVNSQGEAIDPTLFINEKSIEQEMNIEYVTFKIFESDDEYLSALTNNKEIADLNHLLLPLDKELEHLWAREVGMVLIR